MNFNSKFWIWFARIATIIGLLTGGLALYDYLTDDPYVIEYEQRLAPGQKATLDSGEEVRKGVVIKPKEKR